MLSPNPTKRHKLTIIDYKEAPSGRAIVGKLQPPFSSLKNGHGFKGVLLQDAKRDIYQCHICGEWFESLLSHILHKHKLAPKKYKEKFGLCQSTALCSKRIRLIQSKVMTELRKKNKKNRIKFPKKNIWAANRKGKKKALESQNKVGACDLQITEKIRKLAEELGKTPSLLEVADHYGGGFVSLLEKRFSSYISLCKKIGLEPLISNRNPKYSKEYFFRNFPPGKIRSIRQLTPSERKAFYKHFPSWKEFKNLKRGKSAQKA